MGSKPIILIVDDDNFNRMIIGEQLAQLDFDVEMAEDGQEAWETISVNPKKYDLILLDKIMPRMDGISLLKKIRAEKNLSDIPVVMLTGADRPEDIVEGLAAGAYYYLIKPASQEVLSGVVKSVLEENTRKRELLERIGQQRNNLRLLQRAVFSFRTLQEARDLALLLADASMSPERTVSGYSELLVNAVEHGNLGISYEEKSKLLAEGQWAEEVERRLKLPAYAERKVEVLLNRSQDQLSVTITDQGQGFDWQKYLQFDPERAFDLHGRGIAMSKGISFESIEYIGKGNGVKTIVRLTN